ncbi:hypothetical protein REPUB_Repub05bG0078900 [Reevesia pubescens]
MSQIETLGILEEVQALVSDKLEVVSYKWLSRNFMLSSNIAKRLLAEFVEKHGSGLEVVYSLSGWLKNSPSNYHIQLVTGPKLSEAKQEYDGNCRVHVYSVQACIPKDPAALWNTEFIQAEELFKQPTTADNCLRDNRFCGISTSFVKRNVDGTPARVAAAQPNGVGISGPSTHNSDLSNASLPSQQNKLQQSSSKVAQQPPSVVKDVKSDSIDRGVHDLASKPSADQEKIPSLPSHRKKGQNDKSSTGSGGSLANLWGRASTKPKSSGVPADDSDSTQNPNVSADAQICAREAVEDDKSDDAQEVNFRRASNGEGNRKRRVVLDFSDEDDYEDAVNLASPDPSKRNSSLDSEQNSKTLAPERPNLIVDKPNKDDVKVKEERTTNKEPNRSLGEETSLVRKSRHSSSIKLENQLPEADLIKMDKVTDAAPNSPKRRKVLKTRIDERGREVNEVIWEGKDIEEMKVESDMPKKVGSGTINTDTTIVINTNCRPAAAKKSPAVGSTAPSNPGGRAGNKKAGNAKDPKQGKILSFFKKV